MEIHFHAPVGTVVTGNKEVYLDHAQKHEHHYHGGGKEEDGASVEDAQIVEESESKPDFSKIYRVDSQSINAIEEKIKEAFNQRTKTGVIRFIDEHSRSGGYFKLAGLSNQEKAEELNKLVEQFKPAKPFVFKAEDFENASKPLKK